MAQRDARIAQLQSSKRLANNNLAGATWQNSLSAEMEAVAQQYETSISSAQTEKSRLIEELRVMRDKHKAMDEAKVKRADRASP